MTSAGGAKAERYVVDKTATAKKAIQEFACGNAKNVTAQDPIEDVTPDVPDVVEDLTPEVVDTPDGTVDAVETDLESTPSIVSDEKLLSHYDKHGGEFKDMFNTADEYLQGARDVIENGSKVEYSYKGETRTGYVKFMGNDSKGNAKFAFVGTNNDGYITTFHTESGKTFWKMLNGENIPVINSK